MFPRKMGTNLSNDLVREDAYVGLIMHVEDVVHFPDNH